MLMVLCISLKKKRQESQDSDLGAEYKGMLRMAFFKSNNVAANKVIFSVLSFRFNIRLLVSVWEGKGEGNCVG